MALRKVKATTARRRLPQVLPPVEEQISQLHARCAQSDLDRLDRVVQLSGRSRSWALRRGLELVEAELLALAARSRRGTRR